MIFSRYLLGSLLILSISACNAIREKDRICLASRENGGNAKNLQYAKGYFSREFAERIESDHCGRKSKLLSEVEQEWYPRQWDAACEPSLFKFSQNTPKSTFSIRFSYIPSFDPAIFFRVESDGAQHRLIIKEMSGAGGYEPGVIRRSKEILLDDSDVREIKALLVDMEASRVEQRLIEAYECGASFDGTQWIFETVQNGQYDMYKFEDSNKESTYKLAAKLFEKSGWWDESSD